MTLSRALDLRPPVRRCKEQPLERYRLQLLAKLLNICAGDHTDLSFCILSRSPSQSTSAYIRPIHELGFASRNRIASSSTFHLSSSTSHSVLSLDFCHHCSSKLLHPNSADENNLVLFYIVVVNSSAESGYPFVSVADSTSPQSLQLVMQ
jgi:hypothetical protein